MVSPAARNIHILKSSLLEMNLIVIMKVKFLLRFQTKAIIDTK